MMKHLNATPLFFFGADRPLNTLPFQSFNKDSTANVPWSKEDFHLFSYGHKRMFVDKNHILRTNKVKVYT